MIACVENEDFGSNVVKLILKLNVLYCIILLSKYNFILIAENEIKVIK